VLQKNKSGGGRKGRVKAKRVRKLFLSSRSIRRARTISGAMEMEKRMSLRDLGGITDI
jgi:hypothetical protein